MNNSLPTTAIHHPLAAADLEEEGAPAREAMRASNPTFLMGAPKLKKGLDAIST
jgi:hypothetical protein